MNATPRQLGRLARIRAAFSGKAHRRVTWLLIALIIANELRGIFFAGAILKDLCP